MVKEQVEALSDLGQALPQSQWCLDLRCSERPWGAPVTHDPTHMTSIPFPVPLLHDCLILSR